MAKHLVDIDEQALLNARAQLGAGTIKETVNRALRLAGGERGAAVKNRLDALAHVRAGNWNANCPSHVSLLQGEVLGLGRFLFPDHRFARFSRRLQHCRGWDPVLLALLQ